MSIIYFPPGSTCLLIREVSVVTRDNHFLAKALRCLAPVYIHHTFHPQYFLAKIPNWDKSNHLSPPWLHLSSWLSLVRPRNWADRISFKCTNTMSNEYLTWLIKLSSMLALWDRSSVFSSVFNLVSISFPKHFLPSFPAPSLDPSNYLVTHHPEWVFNDAE